MSAPCEVCGRDGCQNHGVFSEASECYRLGYAREKARADAAEAALARVLDLVEGEPDRLRITSHADGLGMGWLAGEVYAGELGCRLHAAAKPKADGEGRGKP